MARARAACVHCPPPPPPPSPTLPVQAYLRKSRRYHPDRNGAPEARAVSQAVNNAYSILRDDAKRAAYDASAHKDTGGVDLFSGLQVTRDGVVIGAMGSTVGAVAGFGVGGVAGAALGAASGTLFPYTTLFRSRKSVV